MRQTEKAKESLKVAERVFLLFSINMYMFSLIAVILPSNRSILPNEAAILLGEELIVPGVFHDVFTGVLIAAGGCICLLNILRLYKGYRAQREFGSGVHNLPARSHMAGLFESWPS